MPAISESVEHTSLSATNSTCCAFTADTNAKAKIKIEFFKAFLFWFLHLVVRCFPLNDAFFGYDIALVLRSETLNVVEIFLACSIQHQPIEIQNSAPLCQVFWLVKRNNLEGSKRITRRKSKSCWNLCAPSSSPTFAIII